MGDLAAFSDILIKHFCYCTQVSHVCTWTSSSLKMWFWRHPPRWFGSQVYSWCIFTISYSLLTQSDNTRPTCWPFSLLQHILGRYTSGFYLIPDLSTCSTGLWVHRSLQHVGILLLGLRMQLCTTWYGLFTKAYGSLSFPLRVKTDIQELAPSTESQTFSPDEIHWRVKALRAEEDLCAWDFASGSQEIEWHWGNTFHGRETKNDTARQNVTIKVVLKLKIK